MKNFAFAFMVLITLFVFVENLSAQSGSRNFSRRTRRTPTAEEIRQAQQLNLQKQQAQAQARYQQTLRALAENPDGSQNKRQYSDAFKDAKREFMAIRNKTLPASGRRLERPFVLRSRDVDRKKRSINWPDTLKDDHESLIGTIESGLMDKELSASELQKLLQQLSQQIEQRVLSKSINIKEYATAKRFVSGLANEADL
jgi:hypothetical protein